MNHKAEIINLKRNIIIYKDMKKIRVKRIFTLTLLFLLPLSLLMTFKFSGNSDLSTFALTCVNPIYSPYNENGNIVFTSTGKYFFENSNVEFIIPAVEKSAVVENGKIKVKMSENTIILAPANGIVIEIGKNENMRFIKLAHANDYFTVIENIDICGVKEGFAVKQGKQIGIAKSDITMKIYKNKQQITKLNINENQEIICG